MHVGEEDGPFTAAARTRADGTFRIGALEVGRVLAAWIDDERGEARTEIEPQAGRTELWEAVLVAGGEVRGRVLDERGAPLAGWQVRLEEQALLHDGKPGHALRLSAADGGFVFTAVPDRPHQLGVSSPRAKLVTSLVRRDVRPDEGELELRVLDGQVPSVSIVGTFLDEAGRAIPTAQVWPGISTSTWSPIETCDPRTGRFELGPFPPASTLVFLKAPERAGITLGPRALAAGETWDVGEVRLAPEGRLRVRLVPQELDVGDALELQLDTAFEPLGGTGAERLSPPLAPGRYTLNVGGGSYAQLALPFTIESEAETVLDVPLRRGWRTSVAVRAPSSVGLGELRVGFGDGSALQRTLWQREGERFVETLHLAAGTYTLEARAGELHASGTLVVEPVDREEPALELRLE